MTTRSTLYAGVAIALLSAFGSPASAVTTIVDDFDDAVLGTNTSGAGSGFVQVSNAVGGSGTVVESGTQVMITTTGNNNNSGIVSLDTLTVGATDTVTVSWDVRGISNIGANGLELLIQGGTGFRDANFLQFKVQPNGSASVNVFDGATNTTVGGPDATTLSEAIDGFTLMLTADAAGWSIANTSYASLANLSGGYGTLDFVSIFSDGRVAATVQQAGGGAPAATLTLDQISVSVIPEPSAAVLATIGLLGLLRRRR